MEKLTTVTVLVRILLSILVGGFLGLERAQKARPAGFRTYALVCLGATLVMMTNQYVFLTFKTSDPVRMGAQVISGIGFIGAGCIITTKRNQIKGITTAAGLWTSACCGLAIGIGFYKGAVLGAIAIFAVMKGMQKLDAYIHAHSRNIELYMEFEENSSFSEFLEYSRLHNIDITDIQLEKNKFTPGKQTSVIFFASTKEHIPHSTILDKLSNAPGVAYIEEI